MPNASELAIGPIFIGFFFNVLLYGVMLSQIYIYFTMFYCDKAWLKTFVLVILALDTLNTAFDFAYLYRVLISNFGNTSVLARADWIFATDPVLTALIACCVQLFYAWRVQLLSRKLWLVILVVVCALAGLAGGLATTIEVVKLPHFKDFQYFKAAVIVWLAAECVADILITTILVKHLKSHKTGFKGSDILIDQVIRLTIQTGLLTSLCATVDLILYLADPVALHLIFNIPLCKLYSNSLMSSLNSRREWATGAANDSGIFSQIILPPTFSRPSEILMEADSIGVSDASGVPNRITGSESTAHNEYGFLPGRLQVAVVKQAGGRSLESQVGTGRKQLPRSP